MLRRAIEDFGASGVFLVRTLRGVVQKPLRARKITLEIYSIGWQSVAIILFTGFFTGMVLGLQGYYTLKRFGADGFLGSLIQKSLLAELAPVLTALLIIGRAGSALCAELGVMRISEQIEALECLAIDVYNFLVSPKLVAALIAIPLLIAVFTVSGILGGYVSGSLILGVSVGDYYHSMRDVTDVATIRMALIKGLVFAVYIVTVCAYKGLYVHQNASAKGRGALALSNATTQAVVIASVGVLILDYLLTAVLI
ncbi:MAG: putative phospholipid ABC transporter permease protein MlaE [Turneriella sp.]|nr:putative phospholipid ABC transporter permease protein MlaE [Turneriella sp.]